MSVEKAWAIARNLVVEILRMRILMSFIILLTAAYTIIFAWWLHQSRGPVDEKVQTFLSYSLSFTLGFLALLTIFIAIATITRDIQRKEIFTITTKCISRGHYLVGKLLGLAVLNLLFLGITAVIIYYLAAIYLPHSDDLTDAERNRLEGVVLTARRGVMPQIKDVRAEVKSWVDDKVEGELRDKREIYRNNPDEIEKMRRVLTEERTRELIQKQTAVSPGNHIVWHFRDIQPLDRENGLVFIRFKQDVDINPRDDYMVNEWMFGAEDPLLRGGMAKGRTRDSIRTVHEFGIPARLISPQGDLFVYYRNPTVNRVTAIFPLDTGIEVTFTVGGFTGNFLRTIILMYVRLIFLAVLGLAAGTWLSFPTAVLMILVIYVLGLCSNFIYDAIHWETGEILRSTIRIIMVFIPNFSAWDPVPLVEKGRLVSLDLGPNVLRALDYWSAGEKIPAEILQKLILLKDMILCGLAALIGYLIFRFRELARVIV